MRGRVSLSRWYERFLFFLFLVFMFIKWYSLLALVHYARNEFLAFFFVRARR